METLGMGFTEVVASVGHAAVAPSSASTEKSSRPRATFQWGGTIFAFSSGLGNFDFVLKRSRKCTVQACD
uniref:Uncharacterized protein n=1 Tax=Fagus sylvatica TaxID=28930 RepID=A0A2N9IRW4_FAGSY